MTTTTRPARHRAPGRTLSRWLLPGSVMIVLWLGDNDPGSAAGFGAFLGLGLVLSLFCPLLALLALEAPGALVPWRWRAWRRRGVPDRPHISSRLRRIVYAADRHACAYCKSSADIQLDHVRPWSLGGRTSFFNSMTLCRTCNIAKSNYWRDRDGYVHYRSWKGYNVPGYAAAILTFELRHRWNIIRFIRASMSLLAL